MNDRISSGKIKKFQNYWNLSNNRGNIPQTYLHRSVSEFWLDYHLGHKRSWLEHFSTLLTLLSRKRKIERKRVNILKAFFVKTTEPGCVKFRRNIGSADFSEYRSTATQPKCPAPLCTRWIGENFSRLPQAGYKQLVHPKHPTTNG